MTKTSPAKGFWFSKERRAWRGEQRRRAAWAEAKRARRADRHRRDSPPPLSSYRNPEEEFITRYGDPFD
jgi:hypothetical protein